MFINDNWFGGRASSRMTRENFVSNNNLHSHFCPLISWFFFFWKHVDSYFYIVYLFCTNVQMYHVCACVCVLAPQSIQYWQQKKSKVFGFMFSYHFAAVLLYFYQCESAHACTRLLCQSVLAGGSTCCRRLWSKWRLAGRFFFYV